MGITWNYVVLLRTGLKLALSRLSRPSPNKTWEGDCCYILRVVVCNHPTQLRNVSERSLQHSLLEQKIYPILIICKENSEMLTFWRECISFCFLCRSVINISWFSVLNTDLLLRTANKFYNILRHWYLSWMKIFFKLILNSGPIKCLALIFEKIQGVV